MTAVSKPKNVLWMVLVIVLAISFGVHRLVAYKTIHASRQTNKAMHDYSDCVSKDDIENFRENGHFDTERQQRARSSCSRTYLRTAN
jgi:hypothetical protein